MSLDLLQVIQEASLLRGLPPSLTHALIQELSGGIAYVQKSDSLIQTQIEVVSKKLKVSSFDISEALHTKYGLCSFEFDELAWRFFMSMQSISFEEKFLLSCKLGLTRRLGKDYAFNSKLFDKPVDIYSSLKLFMENIPKQIDLLLTDMQNFARPDRDEDAGGILLGISRIFHRQTPQILPIARKVIETAKALEPNWQERLKQLDVKRQAAAVQLHRETHTSDPGKRKSTPD